MAQKQYENIDMGSAVKVINEPDPVNPQDVATKNYVDARASSGTITGDGATTAFTITHNLSKVSPYQMVAQFYNRTGTDQQTFPSISSRGANSFVATWTVAPAQGAQVDWKVY